MNQVEGGEGPASTRRRLTFSAGWLALLLALWGSPLAAGQARRPAVDLQAMREAMNVNGESDSQFPSASSYAHFLKARLAHHEGEHREALDELRLALASDDANPYLMTQLAEQYARLSDLDRAEAQLKKVIDRAPDYAPAQLMMGRVLYEAGKTTRARAHLARAIHLKPQDADAYLVLTQLWLDQGKTDEAVKIVEELGVAIPGEPIGFRRLGLALAERGDSSRAEKLLLHAVDRDPGDIESWVALGRIAETSGRVPAALEDYGRALEGDPDNREVLLAAGRLALRMDRPADARAYFDQLLSLGRDPETVVKVAFSFLAVHQLQAAADILDQQRKNTDEPRLHFYAGLVQERLHAWQRAADAFDAVPKEVGDLHYEARLHRAMCLSSLAQNKLSLEVFRKLNEERPELPGLGAAYARALERAGQVPQAEALLQKTFAGAASPNADLLDSISAFYARQNRIGEAVTLFSGALVKRPKDEALVFALASALERKGEWQKAVEKMRELLVVNPQHTAAMNFIGYTLADRGGDLDEAEKLVKKALDSRPDSAAYLDSMGWVLYRRGELDRSVQFLERATEESPDEPTLLEHLGDVYSKAAKRQRAIEIYGRATQLLVENPDSAERPNQKAELERKLKLLTTETAGR